MVLCTFSKNPFLISFLDNMTLKSRANYILDPQKQKKKKNTEDDNVVSRRININELCTNCQDRGYEIKLKIFGFEASFT